MCGGFSFSSTISYFLRCAESVRVLGFGFGFEGCVQQMVVLVRSATINDYHYHILGGPPLPLLPCLQKSEDNWTREHTLSAVHTFCGSKLNKLGQKCKKKSKSNQVRTEKCPWNQLYVGRFGEMASEVNFLMNKLVISAIKTAYFSRWNFTC